MNESERLSVLMREIHRLSVFAVIGDGERTSQIVENLCRLSATIRFSHNNGEATVEEIEETIERAWNRFSNSEGQR